MFIARISRKSGEKVIKDEMSTDDLADLLEMLGNNYDNNILEIHIFKEEK